jgi:hypothetical protein
MLLPLLICVAAQAENVAPTASLVLPAKVVAGKAFTAQVKLKFAEGLHGYQNPPSDPSNIPVVVKLKSGSAKLVSVSYPKGVTMSMAGSPPLKVYSGAITINVSFKAGSKSGPLVLNVDYQQCTEATCFPPSTVVVKGTLTVKK